VVEAVGISEEEAAEVIRTVAVLLNTNTSSSSVHRHRPTWGLVLPPISSILLPVECLPNNIHRQEDRHHRSGRRFCTPVPFPVRKDSHHHPVAFRDLHRREDFNDLPGMDE
jgi:hypothetical protein